mgnify:FL=1
MATTLTRTIGTPTSQRIGTLSFWLKRCQVNRGVSSGSTKIIQYQGNPTYNSIWLEDRSAQANWSRLRIHMDDTQSPQYVVGTEMRFRDCNAWYHIVIRIDTTQATAANRIRVYINGGGGNSGGGYAQLGGLSDEGQQPAQNYDIPGWASGQTTTIGGGSSMYLAQMIFADGQSYAPSTFGSFDSNGEWVPNSNPSVTYGNNGYKLDFKADGASAAAGNFGSDSSGNNNHFTSNNLGTHPSTTDAPENNFSTLNYLQPYVTQYGLEGTLTKGNLYSTGTADGKTSGVGNMGLRSGKWYWEAKLTADNNYSTIGVHSHINKMVNNQPNGNGVIGYSSQGWAYWTYSTGYKMNNDTSAAWGVDATTGDILSVALDLDNLKIYIAKNGTWMESGDPTSGASGTGSMYTLTAVASTFDKAYFPVVGDSSSSQTATWELNFGNPTFSIASSNADANGYGKFEYAVPSGYYAICSKNVGQYGG